MAALIAWMLVVRVGDLVKDRRPPAAAVRAVLDKITNANRVPSMRSRPVSRPFNRLHSLPQAVAASAGFRYLTPHAPVAQLDRALPSEGRGQGFESLRARQLDAPRDRLPRPSLGLERVHVRVVQHRVGADLIFQQIVAAAGMVVHAAGGAVARCSAARRGQHLAFLAPFPIVLVVRRNAAALLGQDIVAAAGVVMLPACRTLTRRSAAGICQRLAFVAPFPIVLAGDATRFQGNDVIGAAGMVVLTAGGTISDAGAAREGELLAFLAPLPAALIIRLRAVRVDEQRAEHARAEQRD